MTVLSVCLRVKTVKKTAKRGWISCILPVFNKIMKTWKIDVLLDFSKTDKNVQNLASQPLHVAWLKMMTLLTLCHHCGTTVDTNGWERSILVNFSEFQCFYWFSVVSWTVSIFSCSLGLHWKIRLPGPTVFDQKSQKFTTFGHFFWWFSQNFREFLTF